MNLMAIKNHFSFNVEFDIHLEILNFLLLTKIYFNFNLFFNNQISNNKIAYNSNIEIYRLYIF